jgi:hypothetical protein
MSNKQTLRRATPPSARRQKGGRLNIRLEGVLLALVGFVFVGAFVDDLVVVQQYTATVSAPVNPV